MIESASPSDDAEARQELARRIKAAIAYGRIGRKEAAEIFGVSRTHLDRYTRKRNPYAPPPQALRRLVDRADLPREWWYADLARLAEITSPDAEIPRPGGAEVASRRMTDAHRRAAGDMKRPPDETR